jgi:hypothetical protein
MCTVTFRRNRGRVLVVMNRDERWGRSPEHPPRVVERALPWMAPFDGEKGGTWIGVNSRGTVACLLNAYEPGDLELLGRSDVPSRGSIVPSILELEPDAIASWVRDGLGADRFPSFTVLIFSAAGDLKVEWRIGGGLSCTGLDRERWSMVSSSAWRTREVLAWRAERFEEWREAGAPFEERIPSFNLLEVPELEEWSPFVTRSFSATRSLTRVEVDRTAGKAGLLWWPRPGREKVAGQPASRLELDLADGPSR